MNSPADINDLGAAAAPRCDLCERLLLGWHPDPQCPKARLPKSNVGFWKPKLAANRSRDRNNAAALERSGWRVLTIWECELADLDQVMSTVYDFLR